MGRHMIEVLCGDEVIATGKRTYEKAEQAHGEMREAFAKVSLKDVIQQNGRLTELLK